MKSIFKYIVVVFLFGTITSASAQPSKSAYFLELMPLRHQLNPALMPERSYFSFPALGSLAVNVSSNIDYTTFVYPSDGEKLNLFLSSAVSSEEFEKNLEDVNKLNTNIDMSIISFGFFKWGGFNTFDMSLRSNISMALPGDLFRFLKNGSEEGATVTQYDLKDISASAEAHVEMAFGHSRRIDDQWAAGVKLKALFGLAQANAHFKKLDLTMSDDQWMVQSYGVVDMSCAGMQFEYDEETGEVSGIDFESGDMGLAGGGAGIDLGGTYTPIDNLIVSMAITDIGFISWKKNNLRAMTPDGEVIYDGFTDIGIDDYIDENGEKQNTFDDQVDDLTDDLEALIDLWEEESPSKRKTWLSPTLSAGAEYQFLDNHISAGVLYSTRFIKHNAHTSLMGSVNFKPFRWFMLGVNATVSNYNNSLGAMLNLGPLFIAGDISNTKVSGDFIPLNKIGASVNFGISIPLGKDPKLKEKEALAAQGGI